jgi:hypothetical protein
VRSGTLLEGLVASPLLCAMAMTIMTIAAVAPPTMIIAMMAISSTA